MKKLILIVCSLAVLYSCKKEEKGFKLLGTVENAQDSTWAILSANNKILDSAMVIDEKFFFTGIVEEPTEAILFLRGSEDRAYLFIENSKMSFIATKGNLIEGKTTGSKSQKEEDIYLDRLKPVEKHYDGISPMLWDKNLSRSTRDSLLVITDSLRQERFKISQQFIREYPNSYTSTNLLDGYKFAWGKEKTQQLYALMNKERQGSEKGKNIEKYIALNISPQIGEQYVDLELENVKGEPIKLSDMMGKFTLLEFWAAWCMPCRRANPQLVEDYKRFKSQGFEIYAVSLDEKKGSWIKAIKEDGLLWENFNDFKGRETEPALIYGVSGIPDNFLIDENGTIVARDLRGEVLTKKLEELFGEKQLAATK